MCNSKVVNVVVNSNNALANSSNNNATYNIDWGAILKPNQAYLLTWTYTGQPNTLTSNSKIPQVQIDFIMEQYLNASSTYGAPTTFTIGTLRSIYLNNAINFLYADTGSNPPIYLATRPSNNTFRIQVVTNDAPPVGWKDNASTPVVNNNYILTLSFEEVN